MEWTKTSRHISFNIYDQTVNVPIKTESFSSTMVSGLTPSKKYSFAVTAIEGTTGKEVGLYQWKEVETFPTFTGLSSTALTVKSPTRIDLTWSRAADTVVYKIYQRKNGASWDFSANPIVTSTSGNTASATSLEGGTQYCFYAVASYLDGTSEPSTTDMTVVNSLARCAVTQTSMANLPVVTVSPVTFGPLPWFVVSGGDPAYTTDIYETTMSPSPKVASKTGNGTVRSSLNLAPGNHRYSAIVKGGGLQATVEVKVAGQSDPNVPSYVRDFRSTGNYAAKYPSLQAGGKGVQQLGQALVTGDFNCDGLEDIAVGAPEATPYVSPQHLQNMGAVVVYYGYLPPPIFSGGSNHIRKATICNRVIPNSECTAGDKPTSAAAWPNPQLIYYPAAANGVRFGRKLAVGNINNDCVRLEDNPAYPGNETTQPKFLKVVGNCDTIYEAVWTSRDNAGIPDLDYSGEKGIKQCQDLVVSTGSPTSTYSALYAIFGDPLQGLVSGSGGNNFGINEFTCDSGSNSCRAVRITETNLAFVRGVTLGDYNNDGFDDIAVTAKETGSSWGVRIYRGSAQGVTASSSTKNHVRIEANGVAAPCDTVKCSLSVANLVQPIADSWNSAITAKYSDGMDFGADLATAYNSRLCDAGQSRRYRDPDNNGVDNPPRAQNVFGDRGDYDFSKCDDLIIGIPGRATSRGAVMACAAIVHNAPASSSDPLKDKIEGWNCSESFPAELSVAPNLTGVRYGASLLGVPNQNGYPIDHTRLKGPSGQPPTNIGGALFVGAPQYDYGTQPNTGQNGGKVYAYYVTPRMTTGIKGALGDVAQSTGHAIEADNLVACNAANNNLTEYGGTGKRCMNQSIRPSPVEGNAQFGAAIATISDVFSASRGLPSLAISAPFKDVRNSAGTTTIIDHGMVYVYRPDISTFGFDNLLGNIGETIAWSGTENHPACNGDCSWYSGGISPFGPSFLYPADLTAYSYLGLGGMAGGNFNDGENGDIVVSAYGSSVSAPLNGGVYVIHSTGAFNSTENGAFNTPDLDFDAQKDWYFDVNVSNEINYQFQDAKVIGDVNGDGYDDVISHITVAGIYKAVLFYGSAGGLITTPEPSATPVGLSPLLLYVPTDVGIGKAYFGVGSVNGDAYDDLLLLSDDQAYVYYGSFAGLVASGVPTIAPIGPNPHTFAKTGGMGAISLTAGALHGDPAAAGSGYYQTQLQAVTHGDFNGDGCQDVALGLRTGAEIPRQLDLGWNGTNFTMVTNVASPANYPVAYAGNSGRVMVIYGSPNGLQVSRVTGRIFVNDGTPDITETTPAAEKFDVVGQNPCTGTGASAVCKVQLIASRDVGLSFGYSLVGIRSLEGTNEPSDELLVGDPDVDTSVGGAYLYKGTPFGLSGAPAQKLIPPSTITVRYMGQVMASLGDVDGDQAGPDVAIAAPGSSTMAGYVFIFYAGGVNGESGYQGEVALNDGQFWASGYTSGAFGPGDVNKPHAAFASGRPQVIRPTSSVVGDGFGNGLAGLGDFNGDGFADLAINTPAGDYNIEVLQPQAGYVTAFFGSQLGIQADASISPTPRCFAGIPAVCEPYQMYLPNRESYELTYISKDSVGDINGDNLPDLMIGGIGRTHPSGKAFSVGVLHVLY